MTYKEYKKGCTKIRKAITALYDKRNVISNKIAEEFLDLKSLQNRFIEDNLPQEFKSLKRGTPLSVKCISSEGKRIISGRLDRWLISDDGIIYPHFYRKNWYLRPGQKLEWVHILNNGLFKVGDVLRRKDFNHTIPYLVIQSIEEGYYLGRYNYAVNKDYSNQSIKIPVDTKEYEWVM